MHHRHREPAAIAQIGDGAIASLHRAVDHDLVPFLRMTDIGDSKAVLLGPEEGDRIEGFTAADAISSYLDMCREVKLQPRPAARGISGLAS